MKITSLVIALLTLSGFVFAQSKIQIDWKNPKNTAAKKYKSTFEAEVVKAAAGEVQLLNQRYLMINPGCGSECQVIGYLDTKTGIAYVSSISSSYGIEFSANSPVLTINPKAVIEEMFGPDGGPSYARTQGFTISESGSLVPVAQ